MQQYCEILSCWSRTPCGLHNDAPKKVLVLGLSANPPTYSGGHFGLFKYFNDSSSFDQIWALPVYAHMFAAKRDLAPFEHRIAMLKLALGELRKVKVLEIEKELADAAVNEAKRAGRPLNEVRVGTVDVLSHLQALYPATEFSLCLGADTFDDLSAGKWKRGDEILRRWRVVVVDRPGQNAIPESSLSPRDSSPLKFEVMRAPIPALAVVSSTEVRKSRDYSFLEKALHPKVLAYIQQHKLYAFSEL